MANPLKDLDKSAEESYKKARISFQMGNFEESLEAYEKAEKIWEEMASQFSKEGKEAEKKNIWKKPRKPGHVQEWLFSNLADIRKHLRSLTLLLRWSFLRVLLSGPIKVLCSQPWREMKKRLKLSKKPFLYAPEAPKILTNIGIVYFKMGAFEKALEVFDKALSLEPKKASDWTCKIPRFSFFSKNRAVLRPDNEPDVVLERKCAPGPWREEKSFECI